MGLSFGFSKKNITPDFPVCLACSQQKDTLLKNIHDDIFVRCAVLNNDGRYVFILSYDLLFHSRDLYDFVYEYISGKIKIRRQDILINYTHNHNAPSVLGYNDFSASDEYERLLEEKTIACLEASLSDIESGFIEYGVIPVNLNINRRRPSKDGIKLAPNPDGPVDSNLYVLKFLSEDGNLRGILVNYACHPVHYPDTLGLTSEYPGFLCKYFEEEFAGCLPLFIQGAGADSRPRGTVKGEHFVPRSYEYIESMALSMKEAIAHNINSNIFIPVIPSFSSVNFTIDIPTDDEGRNYFYDCLKNEKLSAHLRRNAEFIYENFNSVEQSFKLECGLIKLADNLIIAHTGGEPVCEVKFNIQKILLGSNVIFAGYTDGCAYIVTDEMIAKDGYEVNCFLEYMHKGRIKKGIDEIIARAFKEALPQLD